MGEKWCGSLKELGAWIEAIEPKLPKDGVIILRGDLAAGKTTLVRLFAKLKGLEEAVSSPTFSLQNIYADDFYHYDIYNQGLEQFMSLGLFEELEKRGRHFVEWGDVRLEQLLKEAGFDVVLIEIEKQEQSRCYRIDYA